ncbi:MULTISPECIES: DUF4177 domain-containing protein [Sphingomonas]|uniref:DUF4177 domain-containing protein n=1 Tax=Sphingomonas taxi TaxID=1549858 RepID=A0A097EEQ8_9SPHN|nr:MULTISPECIES: DUF4177 domain-containing protein [Sphingomonas]AIT06063.1 hypothetical protein MC45_06240 [Sphingomonas taxi]
MSSRWLYKTATLQAGLLRYTWKGESAEITVDQALLNFGMDGWELVSTPSYEAGGTTSEIMFIFKKPA